MKTPVHPLGYQGRHLGRIETPSATVSCTQYPAGLALPAHAHAMPNLCAVLVGGFEEVWGRRSDELIAGNVLAKPAGTEHRNAFGHAGARCLNIDLRPFASEWLERAESAVREPRVVREPRAALLCTEIAHELGEPDELTPLAIEADVLALIAAFSRSRRRTRALGHPDWLRSARELVRDRFTDTLKIEDIALELGVSADHLARQFREAYRCSIGEYIRRCRVECAVRSLSDPNVALAEVAIRCGFYDQSHFCRTFKRITGVTPGAWRSRLR